MMKVVKTLLFPHIVLMILLVPISAVLMVYSVIVFGTNSVSAILSYVLSAYTLTIWCFKGPYLYRCIKRFRSENKMLQVWRKDTNLRVNVSLCGSLVWNVVYAFLQLILGIKHHTLWFTSFAVYYFILAVMRFFLVRHTRKYKPGEKMIVELKKYRACGVIFLMMNLALSLIVFFMVYWNRTFYHHEIAAIAMAAYTFTSFTMAIVNAIKYKQYNSPVYSASKFISLASACVSMLTLESTMLTTFGNDTMNITSRRILLGATGGTISIVIIIMAIHMINKANKKIKQLSIVEDTMNEQ